MVKIHEAPTDYYKSQASSNIFFVRLHFGLEFAAVILRFHIVTQYEKNVI